MAMQMGPAVFSASFWNRVKMQLMTF